MAKAEDSFWIDPTGPWRHGPVHFLFVLLDRTPAPPGHHQKVMVLIRRILSAAVGFALVVALSLPARAFSPAPPDMSLGGDAPAAVYEAASEALDVFVEYLGGAAYCLDGLDVTFVEGFPTGAKGVYRRSTREVMVSLETPLGRIGHVVVHEAAHFLFYSCGFPTDPVFKRDFYAAANIPTSRPWLAYDEGWEISPAEIFAETVSALVLGVKPRTVDTPVLRGVVSDYLRRLALRAERSVPRPSPHISFDPPYSLTPHRARLRLAPAARPAAGPAVSAVSMRPFQRLAVARPPAFFPGLVCPMAPGPQIWLC